MFFANGHTVTAYDAVGRVKSTTDRNTNLTTYGYDDAGRRTSVTDALKNTTNFGYDEAGNQTSMTDALQHTTTFVYDDVGRRIRTIGLMGNFPSVNGFLSTVFPRLAGSLRISPFKTGPTKWIKRILRLRA